jgi:hypothetical protein
MAVLPDVDRARIWRGWMRLLSARFEPVALSKDDLRAAVDATDVWIEDNQSAYNQALPQAGRDNLTAGQKTLLFCAVALARVNVDLLRRVFGEVD